MTLHPQNPYGRSRERARKAFQAEFEVAAAEHRVDVLGAQVKANLRGLKLIIDAQNEVNRLAATVTTEDGAKLIAAFQADFLQFGQSMFAPVEGGNGQDVPFAVTSSDSGKPLPSLPLAEGLDQAQATAQAALPSPAATGQTEPEPSPEKRLPGRPKGSRDTKKRRKKRPTLQTTNGEPTAESSPAASGEPERSG